MNEERMIKEDNLKSGVSVGYMRKIVRSILYRISLFSETVVYLNKRRQTIDGFLTVTKEFSAARVYNAVWNDYAELFERGEWTEPGDLIALDVLSDKECYILASKTNNRVVGVHSNEYGFLIGGDKQPDTEDFLQYNLPKFIPVGLCGRCHVKVIGTCKKGDYLVPSDIPGVAEVYNENVDNILTIFGIACENKTSKDIERVRVYLK